MEKDIEHLRKGVTELRRAVIWPLEMRIAKYLVESGYSGMTDKMTTIITAVDPTIAQSAVLKVHNYMRDFNFVHSEKNPYHIKNVPDLFPK